LEQLLVVRGSMPLAVIMWGSAPITPLLSQ